MLLAGLSNAMAAWTVAGNRVLVTGRPYGLGGSAVVALGVPEAPLLDVDEALQRLLVNQWFQQMRPGPEGNCITPATFQSPIPEQLPQSQVEYMRSRDPDGPAWRNP